MVGSISGNTIVPSGTPTRPGMTKAATRFQRMLRQIRCSVWACDATEQMIASDAAAAGGMA